MTANTSQRAGWPNELSVAMNGSTDLIGTLLYKPTIIIFDNQSTAPVAISVNDASGDNVWKTFTAGEALVLDMRANHGIADNFTADVGTSFYGTGTTSTGDFKISYLYAREPNLPDQG